MRRKDREVTEFQKVLEILKQCDCLRIGFKEEEGTYIVPLNFGFAAQGESLNFYFHGAREGKKTELIKEQQMVGFELDTRHELVTGNSPCEFSYLYQSIVGKGSISILEDREEKIKGLKAIMMHYCSGEYGQFQEQMVNATTVMQLAVTEWSCKEHG